jgi:hypothetical protein
MTKPLPNDQFSDLRKLAANIERLNWQLKMLALSRRLKEPDERFCHLESIEEQHNAICRLEVLG